MSQDRTGRMILGMLGELLQDQSLCRAAARRPTLPAPSVPPGFGTMRLPAGFHAAATRGRWATFVEVNERHATAAVPEPWCAFT